MVSPEITPQRFIAKWKRSRGQESAGAQEWFGDLCRVVGHGAPAELAPQRHWFTFERSLRSVQQLPHMARPREAGRCRRGRLRLAGQPQHEQILNRLFDLNLERAAEEEQKEADA